MVLNGPKKHAKGYIEGLEMLASMRLCANVPAQHAIQTALGGYQSISEFITPGGRLYEQRNRAWELINDIPGVSCVKPRGALYMFPKIDAKRFNIHDDQKMVLDFLLQEKSSVGARDGIQLACSRITSALSRYRVSMISSCL